MGKTHSERSLVVRDNDTDLTVHDSSPHPHDQSRDDPTDIVTAPSASSGNPSRNTDGELTVYEPSAQSIGPSRRAYQRRFDKVARKYYEWKYEEDRSDWVASAVDTALNNTHEYERQTRQTLTSSISTALASITGGSPQPLSQDMQDHVDEEMQSERADEMMLEMAVRDITGLFVTET
ncbi:hypothetical protein I350_04504 [Cryptococcus amylolentus CBS 6273]|uniref:Uncharacterized protein n=1 Tax=Cryptococcus amylolentus CBS 6273 TaxID=1296118 RepID=A0A1E3K2B5_9TREE|nr:hypothetical protein I350_04504 [Cryptococcus amylolentus CBS 6273]